MRDSFFKYIRFEKRLSQNTLKAYENDLEQFSDFIQSNFPESNTETCDYNVIRSWVISLVDNGIGSTSVNRKIAALRTYFKFLQRREIITKDPMAKINALKTSRKLPSFVKENDMHHLLDSVKFEDTHEGQRDKLILELFYATGNPSLRTYHPEGKSDRYQESHYQSLGKKKQRKNNTFL